MSEELAIEFSEEPTIEFVDTSGIKPQATFIPEEDTRELIAVGVVIFYDDNGNCLVHGDTKADPAELYKAGAALWCLNPAIEQVRFATLHVSVPSVHALPKVRIHSL